MDGEQGPVRRVVASGRPVPTEEAGCRSLPPSRLFFARDGYDLEAEVADDVEEGAERRLR